MVFRYMWKENPVCWEYTGGKWKSLTGEWTTTKPILVKCDLSEVYGTPKPFAVSVNTPFETISGDATVDSMENWAFTEDPRTLKESQWTGKAFDHDNTSSMYPKAREGNFWSFVPLYDRTELPDYVYVIVKPKNNDVRYKTFGMTRIGFQLEIEPNDISMTLSVNDANQSSQTRQNVQILQTGRDGIPQTATFYYVGDGGVLTELAQFDVTSDSTRIFCDYRWFDVPARQENYAKTMPIRVILTDKISPGFEYIRDTDPYSHESVDRRRPEANFTLVANIDYMGPVIMSLGSTPLPVQSASEITNTFVAGYSRARVSIEVLIGGERPGHISQVPAPIASASASLPGGISVPLSFVSRETRQNGRVYETWEGDSIEILKQTGNFSATVTDLRGFSNRFPSISLNVVSYVKPTISLNTLYRCDADGTANSGGAYFKVAAVANIKGAPDIPQNRVKKLTAGIRGGTQVDISDGAPHIIGGLTNPNSKYTIAVITQDAVSGEIQRTKILLGELHDMVLARGSNDSSAHLGVGMLPVNTGENSSIQLPIDGEFKIGAANILRLLYCRPHLGNYLLQVGDDYNLLAVNATNRFASVNEAMLIQLHIPIQEGNPQWLHLPKEISDYAGQDMLFTVTRFVIFAATNTVFVILLERDPVLGRIWIQYGDLSSPGVIYWRNKWRYISPTTES